MVAAAGRRNDDARRLLRASCDHRAPPCVRGACVTRADVTHRLRSAPSRIDESTLIVVVGISRTSVRESAGIAREVRVQRESPRVARYSTLTQFERRRKSMWRAFVLARRLLRDLPLIMIGFAGGGALETRS